MVNIVFSNYELACQKAIEYSKEIAEDIFVYETRYPAGSEFYLSKRPGGIFAARIPINCIFPTPEHADRYAKKFENELHKTIFVKKKTVTVKGYNFKEGYILCLT